MISNEVLRMSAAKIFFVVINILIGPMTIRPLGTPQKQEIRMG